MTNMTDTSTAIPRKNARMGFAPVQNRVVVTMRSVSNRLNRILATTYGKTLNFHLDCEYPKAGGTWFGKMASEVMQIPYTPSTTSSPSDARASSTTIGHGGKGSITRGTSVEMAVM
jgi:hypothetical protein